MTGQWKDRIIRGGAIAVMTVAALGGMAGLPHPAHLQERKLSTSKPRYKGGDRSRLMAEHTCEMCEQRWSRRHGG